MTTKLEILNLYRFFQKNRFQAVEDVRGREGNHFKLNQEKYKKSSDFYTDPEEFFKSALGRTQDDTNKFKPIDLPAGLDFLNTSNEEERSAKLDGKSLNLNTVAFALKDYIKKYQSVAHIQEKLNTSNLSDKTRNDLLNTYDINKPANNINSISTTNLTMNSNKIKKEHKERGEIEDIYKALPQSLKEEKSIKNYFEKDGLKKDTTTNSSLILTQMERLKKDNKEIIKAVGDDFKVPVGYGTSKHTRKADYEIKSQSMNNSSWMQASESMNDTTSSIYHRSWARRPNWALDKKEKPKFKYKNPKLFQTLMPGENLDFIFEPLDAVLGLGTNLIRRTIIYPVSKEIKHKQNETKELIAFAKKYMPELYNDSIQLPKRHREIMEKNDSSILKSTKKINTFYQKAVRGKYEGVKGTNELYQILQDKFKEDLESEDAKKAFKTLDYITNMYLGARTPWLFQGVAHTTKWIFGSKKTKIQRRIRQATLSGGNYLKHSKKSVEAMEDLFVYFKQSGDPLEGKRGFRKINRAMQKLRDAKGNSTKGDFVELEHNVFEAIQSSNLLKNKKVVADMLNSLKDLEPQAQKENLLRKINLIVGNVSSPRTKWFSLGRRIFPVLSLNKKQKNRAKFEAKLNSALVGINSKDDKKILEQLRIIPNPVNGRGEKIEIPSILENAIRTGKLNFFSRRALKRYMGKLEAQDAFAEILNSKAIDPKKDKKTGRQLVKLDNKIIGKTGLLYSLAFKNQSNVSGIIDAKDKIIVEKDTNKRVSALHEEAYQGLVSEAIKNNIATENIPFYINLKGIEHVLDEVTGKYIHGTQGDGNTKTFMDKVGKATKLTTMVKELKELLAKSGNSFIYKNDSDDNFINRYERLLKDVKELEIEVNYGVADTVSFQKAMEKKYDSKTKTAENLDAEIKNTEDKMNEAIKQGQEKIMSEFTTAVDKKIEEDKNNNKNNLLASKALLDKLQKKEKELDDLLKSTMQAPTPDVEKAKKQIQELKNKVEGKETKKAKVKIEKKTEKHNYRFGTINAKLKDSELSADKIKKLKGKLGEIITKLEDTKRTVDENQKKEIEKIIENIRKTVNKSIRPKIMGFGRAV